VTPSPEPVSWKASTTTAIAAMVSPLREMVWA